MRTAIGRTEQPAVVGADERVHVGAQPDGSYRVRFQRGTIRAQIHLAAQGRIDGLLFPNPQFSYVSRATALAGRRGLSGRVGVIVLSNGASRVAINPYAELAVGSAFKLAVLAAVRQHVAARRLSWTQVVTLLTADKSLPSGILQDRPVGTRFPLAEVARDYPRGGVPGPRLWVGVEPGHAIRDHADRRSERSGRH